MGPTSDQCRHNNKKIKENCSATFITVESLKKQINCMSIFKRKFSKEHLWQPEHERLLNIHEYLTVIQNALLFNLIIWRNKWSEFNSTRIGSFDRWLLFTFLLILIYCCFTFIGLLRINRSISLKYFLKNEIQHVSFQKELPLVPNRRSKVEYAKYIQSAVFSDLFSNLTSGMYVPRRYNPAAYFSLQRLEY